MGDEKDNEMDKFIQKYGLHSIGDNHLMASFSKDAGHGPLVSVYVKNGRYYLNTLEDMGDAPENYSTLDLKYIYDWR